VLLASQGRVGLVDQVQTRPALNCMCEIMHSPLYLRGKQLSSCAKRLKSVSNLKNHTPQNFQLRGKLKLWILYSVSLFWGWLKSRVLLTLGIKIHSLGLRKFFLSFSLMILYKQKWLCFPWQKYKKDKLFGEEGTCSNPCPKVFS
jgi:hypothetical protein